MLVAMLCLAVVLCIRGCCITSGQPHVGEEPQRALGIHFQRGHRAADQGTAVVQSGQHGDRDVFDQLGDVSEFGTGLA